MMKKIILLIMVLLLSVQITRAQGSDQRLGQISEGYTTQGNMYFWDTAGTAFFGFTATTPLYLSFFLKTDSPTEILRETGADIYGMNGYSLELKHRTLVIENSGILFLFEEPVQPGNYELQVYMTEGCEWYYTPNYGFIIDCHSQLKCGALDYDWLHDEQESRFVQHITLHNGKGLRTSIDVKSTVADISPIAFLRNHAYEEHTDIEDVEIARVNNRHYIIQLPPSLHGDFDLALCAKGNNNELVPFTYKVECGSSTEIDLRVNPLNDDALIRTRTFLDAGGTQYMENIRYYDGLGFPVQHTQVGISPRREDIVTLTEFDTSGRDSCVWLPVPVSANGKRIDREILKNNTMFRYGDDYPYSLALYESSPRAKIQRQYGPGYDWHTYQNNRYISHKYQANDLRNKACTRYQINASGALIENGLYPAMSLFVTETIDEDLHPSYEFKDSQGHTLLIRTVCEGENHDIYYVYDEFDNLRYVLPPAINGDISLVNLDLYAYQYRYDHRNRCVWKKLPGVEAVLYVYDVADNMVFSQTGTQREEGKWMFYLYDKLGRLTVQGECSNTNTSSASAVAVTSILAKNSSGIIAGGLANSGYTSNFALASPIVHIVNYYDDYSFRTLSGFNNSTFPAESSTYGKGSLTGSVVSVLGSNDKLYSASYYDSRARVKKSICGNLLNGYDIATTDYTFTNKPIAVTHVHTASGKNSYTETYTYVYDHADRLTRVEHMLDGSEATISLVDNMYDDFGRLGRKLLHDSSANMLSYSYNTRGWLTGITGNRLSQNLYYMTGDGTPCYNGSISSMTWKTGADNTERGYKFTYDGLDRLLNATYGETASINTNTNRFSEHVTGYDKMGNILGLQRYGQTAANAYGLIDNLTMSYQGNKLTTVNDAVTASAYNGGFEFKDGATAATEYLYDADGNLTKDLNKNIVDIQYNVLNLPSRIQFGNGNSISYLYDANGVKLRTTHIIGNNTTTTDYCGGVIYENGTATRLLTEAGYISLNDTVYHYYLQDHQGNNRVVIDQTGAIEEVNHYYPFGGVFASNNSVQPYKYNGKELDRKGGLDWYDYGARHYDAALGRWHVVDPMAEKYYGWSPYMYCLGNPVKFIDPNGMDPRDWNDWKQFGKEVVKAVSVVASVGLQVGGEVGFDGTKVGGEMNFLSQDIAGVRDGEVFHPGGNFDKMETKQEFELGVGPVGVSIQNTIKTENGNQVIEDKQSVSLGLIEYANTETTPIDDNYRKIGKTQEASGPGVSDLTFKAKALVGIELSLDLEKIWDALGGLLEK